MAMTILDMMPDAANHDIRILASDIDPVVVDFAKAATYDPTAAAGIPRDFAMRFTEMTPQGVSIGELPRKLVSFLALNLHGAWPMKGQFDVIFCRNVVIYFTPERQSVLWGRLRDVMGPGGWLFVGHSERVTDAGSLGMATAGITTYRQWPPHR